MAEEEKSEGTQEAEEGGSGSKKTIIIIAVVVLLAIGISVGATIFLLGGDDSEQAAEEAVPEEVPEGPTTYLEMTPPFLVTFNVNGRQRYMQVYVSISTKYPDSLAKLEHHMPLVRSKILSTYGGEDFEVVQTEAGKLALVDKTKAVINEILEAEGEQPLDNVFFTNFVLQ